MKTLELVLVTVSIAALGVGCASTVLREDGSGGGASSSSTGATSTAHSGSTSGSSTGSGNSDCNGGQGCPDGYVCLHADGLCGKGAKGMCQPAEFPPCAAEPRACLCNGSVSAACGTVDISKDPTSCSKGTFSCGGADCKKYIEYCIAAQAQPAGGGPFSGCAPAPASCTYGIADCGCIAGAGPSCQDDGQGSVTVSP